MDNHVTMANTFGPSLLIGVVTFPTGSNDELNNILSEIQKKIVLPAQLPLYQRKKIRRGRWKEKLEQQPIELEIDDVRYQLKHLDGCGGEVPDTRVILWKAMSQMKTKEDWQILPKVMQALSYARKLNNDTWASMIRRAGQAGNMGPVFELAKRPLNDGLRVDSHEKAQKFMTGVVHEVGTALWSEPAVIKGLRDAEKILHILNDENHRPRSGYWMNMSRDPAFLAVPMTMAAVLVSKHDKAEQYGATLRKYADAVLGKWPEGKGLLSIYPDAEYLKEGGANYLMHKSQFLVTLAPILKGFELAEQVLDGEVAAQFASRAATLREEKYSAQAWLIEQERLGKREYWSTTGAHMMKLCFQKEKTKTKTKSEVENKTSDETAA